MLARYAGGTAFEINDSHRCHPFGLPARLRSDSSSWTFNDPHPSPVRRSCAASIWRSAPSLVIGAGVGRPGPAEAGGADRRSAPPSGSIPSSAGRWSARSAASARWCRWTKRAAGCRRPRRAASRRSCCVPGVQVTPDTVVLELSDPQVQQPLQRRRSAAARGRSRLQQPEGAARRRDAEPASAGRHRRGRLRTGPDRARDERRPREGRPGLEPGPASSRWCAPNR